MTTPHRFLAAGFSVPICVVVVTGLAAAVAANAEQGVASLENGRTKVVFDLRTGTYDLADLRTKTVGLKGACAEVEGLSTKGSQYQRRAVIASVKDELGSGRELTIECTCKDAASLLLEFRLYQNQSFLVLRVGTKNATDNGMRVKQFKPLAGGVVFPDGEAWTDFRTLNAPSGANQTEVTRGPYCRSPNNLLLTFRQAGARRSAVLGGLKTDEFVKYAGFLPEGGSAAVRRQALARSWPAARLVAYLDCGDTTAAPEGGRPSLSVVQGAPFTWQPLVGEPAFQSVVFHDQQVVVQAEGLDPTKHYVLGFSWWDFDDNGRVESVKVNGSGDAGRALLERRLLPAHLHKGQGPEEIARTVPEETYRDGKLRLAFTKEGGISNAVVSELWLWELAQREPIPSDWEKGRTAAIPQSDLPARADLEASDPVGKRVDPGVRYMPEDSFYVDFGTANPFEALEQYGRQLRLANHANPNPYDFPTVCAWYTGVWNTSGAQNHPDKSKYRINTTPGMVDEAEKARECGFLRYSRMAGRLVPDNYTTDNPQGWWDDEHWQKHGLYVRPYETSQKWGKAMRERGGLAFTYFQANLVSRDFREAFPRLLLGNDKAKTIDYTNPEAQAHMRKVYGSMRDAVSGMMFDYCDDVWVRESSGGGFHGPYTTATSFYRTWLRLAKEGLGPTSWIHERAINNPPADLALGIVDSQRTSGDTNRIDPAMVSRSGLRWYKNRTVLAYDMDSKELYEGWKIRGYKGADRDGRRMMLTMAYVASSRLLLATSFRDMTPEVLHDLSRTFPYHRTPKSARPIDAFVTEGWPRVYDFEISPKWHQLTLYNNTEPSREEEFTIPLSGDTADGALGLDPKKEYYAYDFWNDRFVGRLSGRDKLAQTLRPGEARMLSVHEVEPNPQLLSTNRHLMQGFVDLVRYPKWDAKRLELSGTSQVVGSETYKVVLALNKLTPKRVSEGSRIEVLKEGELAALSMDRPENAEVEWVVSFAASRKSP